MARRKASPNEVENYLLMVREILKKKDYVIINNAEWSAGRVNKTRTYMAETGVKKEDIMNVLQKLQIHNYSYTDDDRNKNFENEQVWIFGITDCLVDRPEDFYIKLKVRKIKEQYLMIMSFHPERPTQAEGKLEFPYRKDNTE